MNKAKLQIVYSLAILVIVPALLVFNTVLLTTSTRTNYDKELQSRSELSNSVLSISMKDFLVNDNKTSAQEKIDGLISSQTELRNVIVLTRSDSKYNIFASSVSDLNLSQIDILQYDIAYSRKRAVAKSVSGVTDSGKSTRAWSVVTPVLSDQQDVIGLVSSDLLTTDLDEKFDATISRSVIVMAVSVVGVMFLLFNHFKFIGYANLLRKQKELNQTLSDFLSVATHELKAPMSIIKGYISNVTDGDFGDIPDSAKEQLAVAIAQTDRLNFLVQDLLNVSRIEQGKIRFDIEPVNMTDIIKTVISVYTQPAQKKGLTIKYQPESDQNWALVDGGRAQEIITNLVDNAVKYSVTGEILVSHSVKNKMLITSVRDTGIGMSSEERSRLFQRFYRIKNDDTKNISGTGLGLWIIKQYIEQMGGSISVDSLTGSGTEFRVSLRITDKRDTATDDKK